MITLVVSFAGKYLLEIARFKLWRAYSVNTSVSLVAGAWSASVSKICEQISDGNSLREQILQNLLDLAKSKKLRHQFIHENRIALLEVY